jgi:hypothetical protein
MVACHIYKDHDGPHTWEYEPSLARLGLNRLLALMPTRELESVDSQPKRPLKARDVRTGEESIITTYPAGPWVRVWFVGGDEYAIWKATGDVYRVGPDGQVQDPPMLTLAGEGLSEEERTELRRAPRPH